MNDDRRSHTRVPVALSVEVSQAEREFVAKTRDLSLGGCCIESAFSLPEGAEVDTALYVVVDGIEQAGLAPLELRSSVQWAVEAEDAHPDARHLMGLRFLDATPAQAKWLQGIIDRSGGAP